jgi:hypothetical protein
MTRHARVPSKRLIDRRQFMKAAGTAFAASLAPRQLYAIEQADAVFATAYQMMKDGPCGVAVLSEDRKVLFTSPLPDRGHDVSFDPIARRSVVFARRPGTFAVVFDHAGKGEPLTITSPEGRHFFGHGTFSPDGKLLYATENDFDNAAGMIGIYDATDGFARIGEFPTHGMDPHETLLLADGRTLAIANGGIETHPDFGRQKLNIATMQPSFVFVDRISGELLEKHELDPKLHQLSIRHMDFDERGTIWFSGQYEGPESDRPQLIGKAARGEELELVEIDDRVLASFNNYTGAIAANREAGTIAVSSPQGNALAILEAASGKLLSHQTLTEVCGIAPDGAGFVTTTGRGQVISGDGGEAEFDDWYWDNHVLRIG